MGERENVKFQLLIVPHFDTAYNLAMWLTGSTSEAADILQDASLKAFRFVNSLEGENSRAWFLQIVRNTAYTLLKKKKQYFDIEDKTEIEDTTPNAEEQLSEHTSAEILHECLNQLAAQYREVLILRELQELSYEEIAKILQVPQGTVMSRLSRARDLLKKKLISKGDVL